MDSATEPLATWRPSASLEAIRFRANMLRRTRQFFDEQSFIEVQTPCLLTETVVDAHLDPLELPGRLDHSPLYLQTSPEAAMKRLMAVGAEAIYQLGPVFRADESGQFHNLEFTMLEWYRRGDDLEAGVQLLCDFTQAMIPSLKIRRTTYRQLFLNELGFDPIHSDLQILRSAVQQHEPSWPLEALQEQSTSNTDSLSLSAEEDRLRADEPVRERDELLDVLMGLVIQPRIQSGLVVTNFPASQAALARRSDSDPATAERFELYVHGIEIANGYAELCDAEELRERTKENNQRRLLRGAKELPAPERLIGAMQSGLPTCSGTALGFDRLVMVAGGFSDIRQVIAFPGCW